MPLLHRVPIPNDPCQVEYNQTLKSTWNDMSVPLYILRTKVYILIFESLLSCIIGYDMQVHNNGYQQACNLNILLYVFLSHSLSCNCSVYRKNYEIMYKYIEI